MAWSLDARVAVRLGPADAAGPEDALLLEGAAAAPSHAATERFELSTDHAPGCDCCLPRSAAAAALDRLFQRRARGQIPFFRRVLAVTSTPEGDMAVWTALQTDPIASARFRLERAVTP